MVSERAINPPSHTHAQRDALTDSAPAQAASRDPGTHALAHSACLPLKRWRKSLFTKIKKQMKNQLSQAKQFCNTATPTESGNPSVDIIATHGATPTVTTLNGDTLEPHSARPDCAQPTPFIKIFSSPNEAHIFRNKFQYFRTKLTSKIKSKLQTSETACDQTHASLHPPFETECASSVPPPTAPVPDQGPPADLTHHLHASQKPTQPLPSRLNPISRIEPRQKKYYNQIFYPDPRIHGYPVYSCRTYPVALPDTAGSCHFASQRRGGRRARAIHRPLERAQRLGPIQGFLLHNRIYARGKCLLIFDIKTFLPLHYLTPGDPPHGFAAT